MMLAFPVASDPIVNTNLLFDLFEFIFDVFDFIDEKVLQLSVIQI